MSAPDRVYGERSDVPHRDVILRFRPIEVWPGLLTEDRRLSPFDATWANTLALLDRELRALHADERSVVLQAAASERDIRLDGQLRADARVAHPGVILSFESRTRGELSFPCDTFDRAAWRKNRLEGWQVNVRAIALGLEALRKVERYGIADTGQQYRGWRSLPSGAPRPDIEMTLAQAYEFFAVHAGITMGAHVDLDKAYKVAVKKLHPDAGGDPEKFRLLNIARQVIETGGPTS